MRETGANNALQTRTMLFRWGQSTLEVVLSFCCVAAGMIEAASKNRKQMSWM